MRCQGSVGIISLLNRTYMLIEHIHLFSLTIATNCKSKSAINARTSWDKGVYVSIVKG